MNAPAVAFGSSGEGGVPAVRHQQVKAAQRVRVTTRLAVGALDLFLKRHQVGRAGPD